MQSAADGLASEVKRLERENIQHARDCARAERLLREAVDEWPQFDGEQAVAGADLVSWFGAWRARVQQQLAIGGDQHDELEQRS